MEHRWGVRTRLEVPVQIDCSTGVIVLGVMRDASVSGAFVSTAVQLPSMTVVRLVPMSTRCRPRIGIEAFVVRRTDAGVGLEWCDLAPLSIVELLAPEEESTIAVAKSAAPVVAIATPAELTTSARERESIAV